MEGASGSFQQSAAAKRSMIGANLSQFALLTVVPVSGQGEVSVKVEAVDVPEKACEKSDKSKWRIIWHVPVCTHVIMTNMLATTKVLVKEALQVANSSWPL